MQIQTGKKTKVIFYETCPLTMVFQWLLSSY